MKIEDEYVFNNGIYDIAVRSLKATFFDVLTFCDSLEYNSEQDFCNKLTDLKGKMNDIIDSVKDLDSYKKSNNNGLFIKTDVVQNNNIDVPMIDYGEDSVVSKEESIVEEQESANDIENSIDVEADKVEEGNVVSVNEKEEVVDNNVVQNSEIVNNIMSFKKNNDDVVKAILVSEIQYAKLDNSKKSQIEILNQIDFFKDNNLKEQSTNEKDIDSSENLTEKAIMLYKQGKTKEAQEIMDKINSMNNHIN